MSFIIKNTVGQWKRLDFTPRGEHRENAKIANRERFREVEKKKVE